MTSPDPSIFSPKRQRVSEPPSGIFCSAFCDVEAEEDQQSSILSQSNLARKEHKSDQTLSKPSTGDDLDQLLASDMYKLSVGERNDAYEDVHGISQPIEETDEFVAAKIKSLQAELNKIPDARKAAYIQAKQFSSEYVESDKLRLMFLRSKRFDTKEAAEKMVNLFDIKRRLFGSKSLGRPIVQSDLNNDDKKALMAGGMQILRGKDTIGRSVHFLMYNEFRGNAKENCRVMFYNLMTSLEDEEMQKKGVVLLYWMHQADTQVKRLDMEMTQLGTELVHSLPFRATALHYCGPGSSINPVLKMGLHFGGQKLRVRFRSHFGSPLECIYALSSFGISREMLPLDENNILNRKEYHGWLQQRNKMEEGMVDAGTYGDGESSQAQPEPNDVLLGGTGKEFSWHPGNIYFRQLLERYADEYSSTKSKTVKRSACQSVISAIRAKGGRLLLRDGDMTWREIDNDVAQLKLSRAFRNRRRYVNDG